MKHIFSDLPKKDDGFVEKLTTQIIKNVQLTIKNIHIRYEDKITRPGHPFSMGITLSNFSLQTTDENWKATIVQEVVTKIYKVRISINLFFLKFFLLYNVSEQETSLCITVICAF